MCVYRGVARCARQILVLPVRDVLVCAGITVLFGQAKVNDVDQVSLLAQPHQEVVRLDISMDEILGVDVLDATYLSNTRKQWESCKVTHSSVSLLAKKLGHIIHT